MYVLDRTNCKLIAAHPYVKVNWATGIDLATGRPALTDVHKRFSCRRRGGNLAVALGTNAGANRVSIRTTGFVYASTWNVPRIYSKLAPQIAASRWRGLDRRPQQVS